MIARYTFRPAQNKSQSPTTCVVCNSYGDFLFSLAGVQESGEPLTVNSMLAQQDIDPWEEAAFLSTCPPAEGIARIHERLKASSLSWPDSQMSAQAAGNLMRLLYAAKSKPHGLSSDPIRMVNEAARKGPEPMGRGRGAGDTKAAAWRHRVHFMRLSLALVGAPALILISLTDPKAIFSNVGEGNASRSKISTFAVPPDRHPGSVISSGAHSASNDK